MQNYYITENDEKVEIIDNTKIDLSNKNIKEIYITTLTKCKKLNLDKNNLTGFNANLPNILILYLRNNSLTEFKANLPNIKILYLYNNNLADFNADLSNCKLLNLDNNNLTTFKAIFSDIEYLTLLNNNLSFKRISNKSTFYI